MEQYFIQSTEPFKDVPEDEQMVTMLKDGILYGHIPNIDSWVRSDAMREDYFFGHPESRFEEITKDEAYAIAGIVKPYSSIVANICIQDAGENGILPLESFT